MTFGKTASGQLLAMDESEMAELGWRPGQTIADDKILVGVAANARALCREMESVGLSIADDLAAICGHTRIQ